MRITKIQLRQLIKEIGVPWFKGNEMERLHISRNTKTITVPNGLYYAESNSKTPISTEGEIAWTVFKQQDGGFFGGKREVITSIDPYPSGGYTFFLPGNLGGLKKIKTSSVEKALSYLTEKHIEAEKKRNEEKLSFDEEI